MRVAPLLSLALLVMSQVVSAESSGTGDETFARVVVAETELRAGPGVAHRIVHRAGRGEAFIVSGRETAGFWLRVLLPDGRAAYVLGDTVEAFALDEETRDAPSQPGLFAPPSLRDARGGLALAGGVFDGHGYAEVKPALVLAPAIAIEPYAGLAVTTEGRRALYGVGGVLNVAPDWVVAPYVHLGGGALTTFPNEDAQALTRSTVLHARAGGGLLLSLRWRFSVRLEATETVLFTADSYRHVQSYVAGLGTYF